jgi:hypothetical protein
MQLLLVNRCIKFIRLWGATFYNAPPFMEQDNMTDKETKIKAPSKKELMREIENLDTKKVFDWVSLSRTNVANLIAIKGLLNS